MYPDHDIESYKQFAKVAASDPAQVAARQELASITAQAKGFVSEARASAFVGLLAEMAITADASTAARALGDTLQLTRRLELSSYDAAYLELALREGLPLATLDADLQNAMKQVGGALV